MAASKKYKQVRQREIPKGKNIAQGGNPEQYYSENPAWSFASSDQEMWSFSQKHIGNTIWTEIIPRLRAFESQTWSEILVKDKKQNHSIIVNDLNKSAQDRLASKYIEAESLMSLRLTGNHRLYGYMTGRVLNVLWYDDNHGDNNACVCRSYLKHT